MLEQYLQEQWTPKKLLQESLQRSSVSSLVPQASEEGAPVGTDGLGHCRKAEHNSAEDVGPSRDMHTASPEEGIALFDFSLR